MKQIGTPIFDEKTCSKNYMIEMSLEEYYCLSNSILNNNIYQRKRVKSSSSIYSLLREDLKKGCVIPPIVLAISGNPADDNFVKYISDNSASLLILDGLQRSYTIMDVMNDLRLMEDSKDVERIKNTIIRVEVYSGINKMGILYRMLTLNTGQTKMSIRHQIEIIYSDYIDRKIGSVKLITENDSISPSKLGEYKFRDIVDGYTSYIQRDYLTLDREDILNDVKSLEQIAKDANENESFDVFVMSYNTLVTKVVESSSSWHPKALSNGKSPFGANSLSIFNKSQVITGFGAAIGRLVDNNAGFSLKQVLKIVSENQLDNIEDGLDKVIQYLEIVRGNAKKIGNDQRLFFWYFFRGLLDESYSENYLDISASADYAMRQYEREAM